MDSKFNTTLKYAKERDANDLLHKFRSHFVINDLETIYMDGNSLGRMPRESIYLLENLSKQWANSLINGWNEGWFKLSQKIGQKLSKIIGAHPSEVIIADSTSINLFKLVLASLSIKSDKKTVVSDELNFPSDLYVIQNAIKLLNRGNKIQLLKSEDGITITDDEIEKKITKDTSLVTLSHTTFKSGFTYKMGEVTALAHKNKALMLWDLSHSVGAVPINLNKHKVDLAVGCTYKYLNGGPGAPAFLYVKRSLQQKLENSLSAWFGQKSQFKFSTKYTPEAGIKKFLTGTPPIFSIAPIEVGLDITIKAGINALRKKSLDQTSYLIFLWEKLLKPLGVSLNSPLELAIRGSHISLGHKEAYRIDQALINDMKVIPDFRAPDNIRFGITPLYTTYTDIYKAINRMKMVIERKMYKKYPKKYLSIT